MKPICINLLGLLALIAYVSACLYTMILYP